MPPLLARRAPYKDFLQPELQKRFAFTAAIVLCLAYLEALTWSTWDSFIWSWIPLGLPGLRAFAIFVSVLPVVILRIAHSHVGIRTSNSPFETILGSILPFSTTETILTFAFSAWLFSQTYLLSSPEGAELRWITHFTGDRMRLNEQALFFTVNVILVGAVQGILHISLDLDRMLLGTVKPKREGQAEPIPSDVTAAVLGKWFPIVLMRSGMLAVGISLVNYVVLYHFLRRSAWAWAIWIFRFRYNLPRTNIPPSVGPWSLWMLGRSIWASFLLCFIWNFGGMAFRLRLGKEPLKSDHPLTSDSKDPNGSLLNGLKSKKPRISAFAMWELALIARDFDVRRQAMYEDIDRKDGPMWSQLYVLCQSAIKTLEQRIDDYGKPPAPAPGSQAAPAPPPPRERVVKPPTDAVVWASGSAPKSPAASKYTSPGKTPAEELRKRAAKVADQLMTKEQKEALRPEAVNTLFGTLSHRVLGMPVIGSVFQQCFRRRFAKALLGSPYGDVSMYANAAYALSQLAVCSLAEDKYGNVQRDVPAIVRTFTIVIKKLEKFQDDFPFHWTDLEQERECPEASELLAALKDGLGELITAFGPYSSDLRLSRADMRLAKEAAEKKDAKAEKKDAKAEEKGSAVERAPEMQQLS
ncbi:Uu.00g077520.m01.CDS01 [Anthostomella pinea]|uniref:Uu.00g077520.m01.CDS01 n=1 Tax=Anthostomella pinea TaxID=933095 RepID=A0AAI8VW08_9PEZI|nr:Uu.00g077520.m01.CDS01 [Anthostomella pinea]